MGDERVRAETSVPRTYGSFAERFSALAPTKPHNGLYERPATLDLLGPVEGQRVLDAACGPGICSEILARQGATVHGFDVTPEMIALARARCAGLPVELTEGDMSAPLHWLEDGAFDKILCSLALDYLEVLTPTLREFFRVTRPGGTLTFSMGHPMGDWNHPEIRGEGAYHERRHFGLHWSGFGEPRPFVESYRRPLAEILNALVDPGWILDRVVEPLPLPEMKAVAPRLYEELSLAPVFLCIRARKPGEPSTP
ncbi:class I SAM-dependent methyltransferase [Chondromyces crocatus]|uniref:Methylase n=1 Tax=Chondromyces crocatus TaxID=52 RepID=A0A0K1EC54_CHOCO|nr:class I SAM-dependent methyltransferase [Chondromyces crocatus]AKT38466.1 methylase [Chondromyces crocatus]